MNSPKRLSRASTLWCLFLPLVVLPNLGPVFQTQAGLFLVSDLYVVPLLLSLLFSTTPGIKLRVGKITPFLFLLLIWSFITILLIRPQFDYADDAIAIVSLAKLVKISVYVFAGLLLTRTLANPAQRLRFDSVVLATGLVTGVSLLLLINGPQRYYGASSHVGYESSNGISVILAMLLTYLGARFITGAGSSRWRAIMPFASLVMIAGLFVSGGRGGWIALAIGGLYIAFRVGFFTPKVIGLSIAVSVTVLAMYSTLTPFREEVERTLRPEEVYIDASVVGSTVGGLDTGGRIDILMTQAPKFQDSPVVGVGFRHIGELSGLSSSGSHNFWMQMYLETGIVGGSLTVLIIVLMWSQANKIKRDVPFLEIPVKAALLTAFMAGLTEAYFYTGMVVFFLLVVYAPVGSFLPS